MTDIKFKITAISKWIDDSYPVGMHEELVLRRRVDKVGVEYGEMLLAIEAFTGENPRKGVHGTIDDVIKELLDVAVSAIGAVEHVTGNQGAALDLLYKKIHTVYDRAGLYVLENDHDR